MNVNANDHMHEMAGARRMPSGHGAGAGTGHGTCRVSQGAGSSILEAPRCRLLPISQGEAAGYAAITCIAALVILRALGAL